MSVSDFLKPGVFVESDSLELKSFVEENIDVSESTQDSVIALYYAVRDQVAYDPYDNMNKENVFSARRALVRGRGFCTPKAALLAGCCRVIGVPARIGFADVRNHIASPRIIEANGGDIFYWHAFTELYLNNKWVKATPTFDADLCERANILPLDFDGLTDSIFHPFDKNDNAHMEYVNNRGSFSDVPSSMILDTWRKRCPGVMESSFYETQARFIDEV